MYRHHPLIAGLLLLLLSWGCSSAPKNHNGEELHKTLFLDANLQFTLTVPKDWPRTFVPTRVGAPVTYGVRWQAPGSDEATLPAIQVDLLPIETPLEEPALTEEFSHLHPGFNATAARLLEDARPGTLELLGHTPDRTFRVLFIRTENRLYRLSFSSAPEDFEPSRPLFDLVFRSFSPLE